MYRSPAHVMTPEQQFLSQWRSAIRPPHRALSLVLEAAAGSGGPPFTPPLTRISGVFSMLASTLVCINATVLSHMHDRNLAVTWPNDHGKGPYRPISSRDKIQLPFYLGLVAPWFSRFPSGFPDGNDQIGSRGEGSPLHLIRIPCPRSSRVFYIELQSLAHPHGCSGQGPPSSSCSRSLLFFCFSSPEPERVSLIRKALLPLPRAVLEQQRAVGVLFLSSTLRPLVWISIRSASHA